MLNTTISPFLTRPDKIVLNNLFADITSLPPHDNSDDDDAETIKLLGNLNDATSADFEPTVFTSDLWLPSVIRTHILPRYVNWASTVVRHKTDVVFLNHILIYLATSVPSAIWLYYSFSWVHGVMHMLMTGYYAGAFTLLLHNHIHNHGVLVQGGWWGWFDAAFPYVLEPLMGHTWDSYFYHHVKHHHAEGNGPEDLSSTIRYQRDELWAFTCYVGRFFTLVWIELPIYFIRKGRYGLAIRSFVSEVSSYACIIFLMYYNPRPTLVLFVVPLVVMRIVMMIGNWGQHAFVDDVEPKSSYRSSITLIDVPSNRYCFNDGYHTSHHLNPLRHWREHPQAFLKGKHLYSTNHALVFHNIDYLMLTVSLMRKDYDHLVRCMVPIGDQIGMSHQELVALLKTKTRRFTEEEIQKKFQKE